MLDSALVATLGGIIVFQYSTPLPDVSEFVRDLVMDRTLGGTGTCERGGRLLEWLVDMDSRLLFLVARPRVIPACPQFLEALRDAFVSQFAKVTPFSLDHFATIIAFSYSDNLSNPLTAFVSPFEALIARFSKTEERKGLGSIEQLHRDVHMAVIARESVHAQEDGRDVLKLPDQKWGRKWEGPAAISDQDVAAWDHSDQPHAQTSRINAQEGMFRGSRMPNGSYAIAEMDSMPLMSSLGDSKLGNLFARFGLSSQNLTPDDLKPVLSAMQEMLVSKNVAQEVAAELCRAVGNELKGKKVAAFAGGIAAEVRKTMEATLTRLLTPRVSTDLLGDIAKRQRLNLSGGVIPYVLTFVGVNGVGKSTNLSKVAFWLLQNNMRVLIAACDTFRSGAVEQLRTHVRNLKELQIKSQPVGDGVELYERGYGKDAAGIAKDAIAHARGQRFQVVLIDTAGRMQDNEPLMRALAKLISVNQPDKVIFVGEALAGNEALDQLRKFDDSLRRFSGLSGKSRGIDAILLTKYETVDEKVGAAVSMTSLTGAPLMAVGVGQTYGDLRTLRTSSIVDALMR